MPQPTRGLAWQITLLKYGAGVELRETPSIIVPLSPPLAILPNDPDRVQWILMNRSIYYGVLGFNDKVTLQNGIYVAAQGGFVQMNVDEDGEAVTYPVWVISSVAGASWYLAQIGAA